MLFNQRLFKISFVIFISTTTLASCGKENCNSDIMPISKLKNSNTSDITITICRADNTELKQKVSIKANQAITVVWPNEKEGTLNPFMKSCATSEPIRFIKDEREVLISADDQEIYSFCSNGELIQKGQSCALGTDLVLSSCPI